MGVNHTMQYQLEHVCDWKVLDVAHDKSLHYFEHESCQKYNLLLIVYLKPLTKHVFQYRILAHQTHQHNQNESINL